MTTTLPTPTHGAEYTNSVTGDKFKYDSDAGAWEGFEGIDRSGDSMTGTIAYPDMLINRSTLTAEIRQDFTVGETGIDLANGLVSVTLPEPTNNTYEAAIYANGFWYLMTRNHQGEAIRKSRDVFGPWSTSNYPDVRTIVEDVEYGNGMLVAVGSAGQGVASTIWSTDGVNWSLGGTNVNFGGSVGFQTVSFNHCSDGAPRWITAGSSNRIYVSDDGKNWRENSGSQYTGGKSLHFSSSVYGHAADRTWVLGSYQANQGDTFAQRLLYSRDNGESWDRCRFTSSYHKDEATVVDLAYSACAPSPDGKGVFVAVSDKPGESYASKYPIMYSHDGIDWEPSTGWHFGTDAKFRQVEYGGGLFVAVYYRSNKEDTLAISEDGINWEDAGPATSHSIWPGSLAYGGPQGKEKFLIVPAGSASSVGGYLEVVDNTACGGFNGVCGGGDEPTSPEVPEDGSNGLVSNLHFNGDPVLVRGEKTGALTRSVSSVSSRFGTSRYYQAEEPSDSFGIDNGTLWLNPSNAKLSIYYDSDWNQLN